MESFKRFINRKNKQFRRGVEDNTLISMKDISRKHQNYFIREAWTFMPQHNYKNKIFIVERLRKKLKGEVEYRIGYYIVGKIGKAKNKWTWGQFCPLIPKEDFNNLIRKAKREKTII